MKWTHEAPRQEDVGRFFWLKLSNKAPEVVLIAKWRGLNTIYVRIVPATTSDGEGVYCRTYQIAHHEHPSETMKDIAAKTLWAGPIEAPEFE
jgi:hypothetical protein